MSYLLSYHNHYHMYHKLIGLLTLATKHEFAAYFAKLLRNKTDKQLLKGGNNSYSKNTSECGDVYKKYKCLVCIMKNHDGKENL